MGADITLTHSASERLGRIRKGPSDADSDDIRDEDEEPQDDDGHGDVIGDGDQGTAGH